MFFCGQDQSSDYTSGMTAAPDWQRWYRIEPQARYTPQIGALVEMMGYVRMTTLRAVKGLTSEQLDATPLGFDNSIGQLLAHIVAVERLHQQLSLNDRWPLADDSFRPYLGGFTMGQQGERSAGRPLEWYVHEMEQARKLTLEKLAQQDDTWLASPLRAPEFGEVNHHWAWFHVMEDEVNHRGQIRLIHKLVAPAPQPEASA